MMWLLLVAVWLLVAVSLGAVMGRGIGLREPRVVCATCHLPADKCEGEVSS